LIVHGSKPGAGDATRVLLILARPRVWYVETTSRGVPSTTPVSRDESRIVPRKPPRFSRVKLTPYFLAASGKSASSLRLQRTMK
jgi:hypothetical protein